MARIILQAAAESGNPIAQHVMAKVNTSMCLRYLLQAANQGSAVAASRVATCLSVLGNYDEACHFLIHAIRQENDAAMMNAWSLISRHVPAAARMPWPAEPLLRKAAFNGNHSAQIHYAALLQADGADEALVKYWRQQSATTSKNIDTLLYHH